MSANCPYCGCSKIENEPARGDLICTSCGTVLSENNIVSDFQYFENSKGGSSAAGSLIRNDGLSKRPGFSRPNHNVFSRESREITLSNALKRIKGLCQQLRLTPHQQDVSFNIFKQALDRGLTKGRKNSLTIGACVYITCRSERGTPYMLIDVSDALQIDVYELGRSYLRLSTALCILNSEVDPCFYVERFANKLSFGDKKKEVRDTALQLVRRMKKDCMHYGRRPSGLCGAALVIAGRLHNFNRTINDVIKVVKVHESTLRKRLTEFGETPSSALTPEQFMSMDLETGEEQDPPSFIAARKKEKERVQMLLDQQENLDVELSEIQLEIEKHLEERKKKLRGIWAKYDKEQNSEIQKKENIAAQNFITESTLETIDQVIAEAKDNSDSDSNMSIGIKPSAASLGLKDTIQECMEIRPTVPQTSETEILDLTGIDDEEIDSYIMSDREIHFKTKLWMKLNEEYLEEVRLKEEREKEEAEQRVKEGKPEKKKKVYNKRVKNTEPANTAGEAIEKMLQVKKLSNKINYDVLRNLNGESEETSTSEELNTKPILSTYPKSEPFIKPEKIHSILKSLTGKRSFAEVEPCEEENVVNKKLEISKLDVSKEDTDEEEEDEEEEEEEEEEHGPALQLMRMTNEDYHYDDGDYY